MRIVTIDKKVVVMLLVVTMVAVCGAENAWAVSDSGSGTFLDVLGSKAFQLINLVIIPVLALIMVLGFGANYYFGIIQIGAGLMRLFIAMGFVAGGVAMILAVVGGNIATAMVLA